VAAAKNVRSHVAARLAPTHKCVKENQAQLEYPLTMSSSPATRRDRVALLLVLAVAASLRLYRLDSQLWLDEIDALMASIRRPTVEIATTWPGATSHVLYDLCARLCILLWGEHPFALRLPAALFGVLGVAFVYFIARDIFDTETALVAGALMAVSYHHVFQSQNARGYTALILFFLAASRVLVGLQARGRIGPRDGVVYAIAAALAAYSVLLGVFVAAGHAAAVLALDAIARLRRRVPALTFAAFLPYVALCGAVLVLLYSPVARELHLFANHQETLPSGGATSAVYRMSVVAEALRGLNEGLLGPLGLLAATLCAVRGLRDWARRNPFSLAVLATPVLLELAILPFARIPLNPRYFAIALPVGVLACAEGLEGIALDVSLWAPAAVRVRISAAILALAVLASAAPLSRYYAVPKQDFVGAIDRIGALATPGDGRVALHFAGHALIDYYGADFAPIRSLEDLEAQERTRPRVWVVTTLERHLASQQPALYRHLTVSYRLVSVLPATIRDAEMRIYESKP
jgi:mannosyltransferase